ncbi:MAG: hypothetical protein EAZ99_12690 [Alphaproteobacteria bacterium]|nr:MAG: hypothetical protein EAZ99_12690 [Alphaproteobacteria bacterium]
MRLKIHYGTAVTGEQRFARPALEQRLHEAMQSSNGVKMFGLRRIGKSTFRECAIEELKRQKVPYVSFDGQGLNSLSDFMTKWMTELPKEKRLFQGLLQKVAKGPLTSLLDSLTKGTPFDEATLDAYWQGVSTAILDRTRAEPLPILIVDEFSMLMDNLVKRHGPDKANRLLASMREWRGAGVKMLLTGSIGMQRLARQHSLNHEHLNDLQDFDVPELTETEAREFICAATNSTAWTSTHTDALLRESGVLYPCFLVKALLEVGVTEPRPSEDFATIFANNVRPYLHNDFFRQFDNRFKAYADLPGNQYREIVIPILRAVMAAEEPCLVNSLPGADPSDRAEVLDMLKEDGFITSTVDATFQRRWKPASRLAHAWWMQRGLV